MSGRPEQDPGRSAKKAWEKPATIHLEEVPARCVACAGSTPEPCGPGGALVGS
jgi:hypothetical protein